MSSSSSSDSEKLRSWRPSCNAMLHRVHFSYRSACVELFLIMFSTASSSSAISGSSSSGGEQSVPMQDITNTEQLPPHAAKVFAYSLLCVESSNSSAGSSNGTCNRMFKNLSSGTSLCTSGTSASRNCSPSILPVPSDGTISPIKPCSSNKIVAVAAAIVATWQHKLSACI
jgi:hypothetical protein